MKKFLFMLLCAALTLTSCKSTQFGLEYNVAITGDGDGEFEVVFPEGSYSMDGTATLALKLGDTIPFNSQQVSWQQEVLERGNAKEIAAMKAVNDSLASRFSANAASGTYDILVQGYVKEIGTGLTFSVNRRFTNREQPNKVKEATVVDEFPFIE